MTRVRIAGLGRCLPGRVVASLELDRLCGLPAGRTERATGVRERRWVHFESASEMAAVAAREALEEAGALPDLILNASGTAEQFLPDGGPLLQRELGLSGVPSFSVHATCLSFLVALDVAACLIARGSHRCVLVSSSEVTSRGLNFSQPESAGLMGDGAAAAVLLSDRRSRFLSYRMRTYPEGVELAQVRGGGTRRPPGWPETRPEDHLFHMQGPPMLRMFRRRAPAFLEELRPGLSRGLGPVRLVIPHQPSRMGLKTLSDFGWEPERIASSLPHLGNCVAASLPLTLYEAARADRLERGDEVLLLGTGAGLSIAGLILSW
ncbi:MAG: 3-oxoacyl-[acyl-carrier-protein] synthase III C-terminal domain-containing protein [Candidatus Eremiobacterota bacterium]